MAGNVSNKKKTSGGQSKTRGKVDNQNKMPVNKEDNGFAFKNEAILLVILAVSVILFLGNFGLAGGEDSGGNWVSNRLRGLLGITEYIFPIVLFISACFCVMNKGKKQVYIKMAVIYVMMLDVAAIVQLLRGKQFDNLFEQGMSHVFAGGILGGSIAKFLYSMIGFLGAMVVLIVIMVGCIVYMTEMSFVNGVEKQSRRVYEHTKEDMRRRRAEQEERNRQRQRELQRREEEREMNRQLYEDEQAEEERRYRQYQEEKRLKEEKRLREEKRRRAEQEAKRIKKEKIAKQMAYMEKDMQERQAREQQYEKKEYESQNGMSVVTLEQPKKRKKLDEAQKDIHEIFADDVDAGSNQEEHTSTGYGKQASSFTIHRDGEVSEVQVEANKPPKITKALVMENEPASECGTEPATMEETEQELRNAEALASEDIKNSQESIVQNSKVQEPVSEPKQEIPASDVAQVKKTYRKPDISLLKKSSRAEMQSDEALTEIGLKLQQTLQSFGVRVTVTNISCGPTVTRFELQPEQGVKVSKIVGLADDIKLNLAVPDIRIEAPIPGKAAVGIEVPNAKRNPVLLGDLIDSKEFKNSKSLLSFAVGKDIGGNAVIHDVAKMPHLLVAGATGAGKSVCSNTLIMSILYKADPDKVKLIMIDPKVVELSIYNGIPHMLIPVVTDPKKAAGALNWAVSEMSERYNKMAVMGVRDVKSYNEKLEKIPDSDEKPPFLPQIVIIVDELADLMMVAKHEVEDAICRLAQLARAAGIHLIIATQRPSVDVITGLIKANMPSRIALSVSSGVDSRTIIDMNGAEKLLGMGDMLFYPSGYPKPVRVQGAFISDDEVHNVVDFLREQGHSAEYNTEIEEKINQMQKVTVDASASAGAEGSGSMYDEYFTEAGKFVIEKDKGSIGMLQRVFRIGFNRAARIMDQLEEAGVVGAEEGTKPRKVLMSLEEFEQFVEEYV